MAPLAETVLAFFEQANWPVAVPEDVLPDEEIGIVTSYEGQNGVYECYGVVIERERRFAFYTLADLAVPEERRVAMAELITRANYDLIIGNFELDMTDGEIRFKTSIDVEGDELSTALVQNLVVPNVVQMDTYFPGIQKVANGSRSPAAAVADIEAHIPRT